MASVETRRTGENYDVPPPLGHRRHALAALWTPAMKITPPSCLRPPGEPRNKNVYASRSALSVRKVQGRERATGLQPGRSVTAPAFPALSVGILPARLEAFSPAPGAEVRSTMGVVPAGYCDEKPLSYTVCNSHQRCKTYKDQ